MSCRKRLYLFSNNLANAAQLDTALVAADNEKQGRNAAQETADEMNLQIAKWKLQKAHFLPAYRSRKTPRNNSRCKIFSLLKSKKLD